MARIPLKVKTFLGYFLFISIQVATFAYGYYKQKNDPELAAVDTIGTSLFIARGAGLMLALDCSLILFAVCRNTIRWIRSTFLGHLIPFDDMIEFHKLTAYSILVATILHINGHYRNFFMLQNKFPLGYTFVFLHFKTWAGITGVILITAMFFMYTSAAILVRKYKFEFFWFSHQLYFVFFVCYTFHAFGCIVKSQTTGECKGYHSAWYALPGWIIFMLEKIYREITARFPTELTSVIFHPGNTLELRMKKPSMKYQPGQYLYLNIPDVSRREWHPFTISSTPEEEFISVHIKVVGDWTRKLNEKLRAIETLKKQQTLTLPCIRIDGPFGAPAQDIGNFKVAMLVSTGIGITPSASLLKSAWYSMHKKKEMALKKLYFIWVCRNKEECEWFQSLLSTVEETMTRDQLEIHIYITGKMSSDDIYNITLTDSTAVEDPLTNLKSKTHYGRPQWKHIFQHVRQSHEIEKELKVGVFFCGPHPLADKLHIECEEESNQNVSFVPKFEHF